MAQIIKHRRGNAEELGTTTLYKGEMGVTTGSSVAGGLANPIVHIGDGANAGGFVVGRLQYGASTPNISSGYNATLNDILFYNQHTNKLERLHQSGNETLDLFGNLTSGTMSGSVEITGMISASGGITASDIWASGDIHAVGNITFEAGAGGTITLGDSAADNVVFGADVQSSIIPDSNDTYDLGSTGQRWNNLWMSGSLTANGGPHSILSATTIDVDAEGALTLDGGSITIGGDADVVVDVDASSFDLDSSGAISLDSSAGSIDMNVVDGQTVSIGLNGAVETIWSPHNTAGSELWSTINTAGTTDGTDAAGAILLSAVAGGIGLAWADDKDLWAEGGQFVVTANHDTSGAIKLHADAGSSQSIIILNDAGTNAAAIDIQATAGGIDIDAGTSVDILAASTLSVKGATSATFGDDTEHLVYDGSGNVDFDSVGLDIDSSGAITIDGTSTVSIDGADDMNFTITSGTGGEDLTIQQIGANDSSIIITAAGTGTDAVSIDATAGDMLIAPNLINGKTLKIGPSSATQMVFTPHGSAASEKISLINTAGTADDAIKIDAEAGGLTLAAGNDSLHIDADGTDADALNIDSAGGIDVDASAGLTITSTTMALDPSSTFDLDAAGAVTIDGSAITIGADDSGVAISIGHSTSETTINDNLTVTGNLNVAGTETIVDSNVVNISDNIIQVNTGGAKRKGGLQVIDTDGDQTGSVVWDSDGNYFEVGLSGSEYRLPELATATELSANNNKVLISDGARIDASATITDDGSTVDISNRVDAQASLQVTGSIYVSAGASVASSLASLVSFRNNGSTQLGYLASANTSAVTTGLVGYNASTGNLTVSSVIDGGSF